MVRASTAKSAGLADFLRRLKKPQYSVPPREEDERALERVLALILQDDGAYATARRAVKGLLRHYTHWNEVRVARRYEVKSVLSAKRVGRAEDRAEYAQEFLRRVFGLQNHLELDWLYDATSERREKLLTALTMAPPHAGPVLDLDAALADPDVSLPLITTDLKRMLARLGVVPPNPKDAQVLELVEPHVAGPKLYPNYVTLNLHAREICESKHPRCRQCRLLDFCPQGKRILGSPGYQTALRELGLAKKKAGARKAAKKTAKKKTASKKATKKKAGARRGAQASGTKKGKRSGSGRGA